MWFMESVVGAFKQLYGEGGFGGARHNKYVNNIPKSIVENLEKSNHKNRKKFL